MPDGTEYILVIHATVCVLSLNRVTCLWDRSTAYSRISQCSSSVAISRSLVDIIPLGFWGVMNFDLMKIGYSILHITGCSDTSDPNHTPPAPLADASQCPR